MNKTILITGASSGIGRATAEFFQNKGWNVVATMRKPEDENELTKLDNVLVTRLDVQDHDSIEVAVAAGIKAFGGLDVLLNNAGYGLTGTFESISRESILRQYQVNVFGLFDVTRAVLPHFRRKKSGTVINVSSVGGRITFPVTSMYHSTKFAVEGFSESLQYELAAVGIRVKLVEPGGVDTDFGGRSMDFQHDESLEPYNPVVGAVMQAFQSRSGSLDRSTPTSVAGVIYTAATDGKSQLRYVAGGDAEKLLEARKSMDDAGFFSMMKSQMGLQE